MTIAQWLNEVQSITDHVEHLVAALEYLRDHPDIGPDAVRARAKEGLDE